MMTNSGDRWCWHGPEVCKNAKWLNLYHYKLHTHSDGQKHHKQQQGAQVSVWKSMRKSFPKLSSHNLAARLPSEHTRCELQHLQNNYNLPTVCFLDFMYLVNHYQEICTFLYIQATPLTLQWMKTLIWIVRLLFWAVQKQSTSMSVVNANLWQCFCTVDAEPWNSRVCQHSVLPYLSGCNQYRWAY